MPKLNDLMSANTQQLTSQYATEADYRNYLKEAMVSDYTPEELSSVFSPLGISLLQPEDPRKAAREEMSQKVRDNLANFMANRVYHTPPVSDADGNRLDREMLTFFYRYYTHGTPDGDVLEGKNDLIGHILLSGTPEQKKQVIMDRLKEARQVLKGSDYLSDQELAERSGELLDAYKIVNELDKLKKQNLGKPFMDAELVGLIDDIRKNDDLEATRTGQRLLTIANPVFPQLDMTTDDCDKVSFGDITAAKAGDPKYMFSDLYEFGTTSFTVAERNGVALTGKLLPHLLGGDVQADTLRVTTPQGEKLITGMTSDTDTGYKLKLGAPIVVVKPGGDTNIVFMQEDPSHKIVFSDIKADLFRQSHAQELAELEQSLEDVDPMLIRSSDQFKNMKSALKQVKKAYNPSGDITSAADRQQLREQLSQLSDTAFAYLDLKKGSTKQGLEQKRIQAAARLMEYAEKMKAQLSMAENALTGSLPARLDAPAPRRQAAPKQAAPRQAAPKQPQGEPYISKNDVLKRAIGYSAMSFPVFGQKPEAEALLHEAQAGLSQNKINQLYRSDRFTPQQAAEARHQMAAMVAVDLIQRERQGNPPGTLGDYETTLNSVGKQAFVDSIEKSPAFLEQAGTVTPQRYARFITGKQERSFSDHMLAQSRELHHAPENKPNAPAKEKPAARQI